MRITLYGTGAPEGWPVPGCPCASCCWARATGARRTPTVVGLDGRRLDLDATRPRVEDRLLVLPAAARVDAVPDRATAGAPYAVALLDLPGDERGDERAFAARLATLRRRGAVSDATRVVAVGLGHRNPRGPELARRLAGWGVELPDDGAVVEPGPPVPRPRAPLRVLVLGGARSGKSAEAERRLAAEPDVTYVATAVGAATDDPEWAARVAAHRTRRPSAWRTVETTELVPLLREPGGALLIDCLTLWLPARRPDEDAAAELVAAWRDTPRYAVAVSNEVGSGVVPVSAAGRNFRDALGALNAAVAAVADEVWLVTAGVARQLA